VSEHGCPVFVAVVFVVPVPMLSFSEFVVHLFISTFPETSSSTEPLILIQAQVCTFYTNKHRMSSLRFQSRLLCSHSERDTRYRIVPLHAERPWGPYWGKYIISSLKKCQCRLFQRQRCARETYFRVILRCQTPAHV